MSDTKQKVVICKGLPASGKSTWAKEMVGSGENWKRINKDSLRAMIDNGKFSKENEKLVENARDNLLRMFLNDGCNVIIDDTNFNPKQVEQIKSVVDNYNSKYPKFSNELYLHGVEVEEKYFEISLDEALERNALRPDSERVPDFVIKQMHRKYVHKELDRFAYRAHDKSLPTVIICDIDGTLAISKHRNVYDTAQCESDEPNMPVINVLNLLKGHYRIIFMSGRDEKFRSLTISWLKQYGLWNNSIIYCGPEGSLFMRVNDDKRNDSIVKRELYETYIQGKYNVLCVFDDRNRVVKVWRELGLPCWQVADGDF